MTLVVVPEDILFAEGTTIPEDDEPGWDESVEYKSGDRVVRSHFIYSCLEEPEKTVKGVDPLKSYLGKGAKWQPVAPTNLYCCLDAQEYTQTVAPEGVQEMTLVAPWSRGCSAYALRNIAGHTAHVKMVSNENVWIDKTFSLRGGCTNWYDFWFKPWEYIKNIYQTDVLPVGGTLSVTIRGPRPALGTLLVGTQYDFGGKNGYGKTQYGASVRLSSYSSKEINELGKPVITSRYATGRVDIPLTVRPGDENRAWDILKRLESKPALWLGDNGTSSDPLNVFGYIDDSTLSYADCGRIPATIRINGIP